MNRIHLAEKNFKSLPPHHQQVLQDLPKHYKDLKTCVLHNYEIVKRILNNVDDMFENRENEPAAVSVLH